jgi:hypothetical protein
LRTFYAVGYGDLCRGRFNVPSLLAPGRRP